MAARNPIIRIEPLPSRPGMGVGYFQDGSIVPAPLAELEKRYQQADAANRSQMTAQADEPPADKYEAQEREDYSPSAWSGRSYASEFDDPQQWGTAAEQTQATSAGQPVPRTDPNAVATGAFRKLAQQAAMNEILRGKVIPGSPGNDPERKRREGSYVPVARTTETQQGKPYDEEAWNRISEMERAAAEQRAKSMVAAAEVERNQSFSELAAAQRERIDMDQAQRAAESAFQAEYRQLVDDGRNIANAQVDPRRSIKGMSLGAKLAAVVGAAFQGYATKGARNDALDYIRSTVEADIRSQEIDLQNKRAVQGNLLSMLVQKWGSLDAGKEALRLQRNVEAQAHLKSLLAYTKVPAAIQAGQQMLADLEAEQAMRAENLKAQAAGASTQRVSEQFEQPRAATPAMRVGYSGGEILGILKNLGATEEQIQKVAAADQAAAAAASGVPRLEQQERLDRQAIEIQASLANKGIPQLEQMDTIAQRILDKMGARFDNEGNLVEVTRGNSFTMNLVQETLNSIVGDLGTRVVDMIDPVTGEINRGKLEQSARRMNEVSGAAFSDGEWATNLNILAAGAAAGPEAFARATRQFQANLRAKQLSIFSAVGPAVTKKYLLDKVEVGKILDERARLESSGQSWE